jgi:chromosome segregation ATPase
MSKPPVSSSTPPRLEAFLENPSAYADESLRAWRELAEEAVEELSDARSRIMGLEDSVRTSRGTAELGVTLGRDLSSQLDAAKAENVRLATLYANEQKIYVSTIDRLEHAENQLREVTAERDAARKVRDEAIDDAQHAHAGCTAMEKRAEAAESSLSLAMTVVNAALAWSEHMHGWPSPTDQALEKALTEFRASRLSSPDNQKVEREK